MEVLVGVDARLLWRRPRGGVHARRSFRRLGRFRPVDEQGDGVLRLVVAAQAGGHALGGRGGDLDGDVAQLGHHGLTYVDVVAVEVVADVGVDAGPGLERLELRLGLGHVAVEVVEVAELLGPEPGVRVGRVVTLVVLDVHVDAVLLGGLDELQVV